MEIIFILVNPAVPENIGFSLRALNTFGFNEVRLVGHIDKDSKGLRKTAYGSHNLIEDLEVFENLADALEDIDMSIGTTSKSRTTRKDSIDIEALLPFISDHQKSVGRVAIVFGSEENGLSKQEINQCNVVSTIPLATKYPSLNLAQSILIYAYELAAIPGLKTGLETQNESSYRAMMDQGKEIFEWLDLHNNPVLYQRLIDRLSLISDTDINMVLSVMKKLRLKSE